MENDKPSRACEPKRGVGELTPVHQCGVGMSYLGDKHPKDINIKIEERPCLLLGLK